MAKEARLSGDWILSAASVTAIRLDGVPVVQDGLTLRIIEGRGEQIYPSELVDEYLSVLEYELSFTEADSMNPDEIEMREATIVIVGRMPDGRPCKIWGNGHVGRDNLAQIEGSFEKPPRMEILGPAETFSQLDEVD